jgi:hypothetical protein
LATASLEGFRTTKNPKPSANRPICVKRETDCERILDLLARSAGGEDCTHVILIHGVLSALGVTQNRP